MGQGATRQAGHCASASRGPLRARLRVPSSTSLCQCSCWVGQSCVSRTGYQRLEEGSLFRSEGALPKDGRNAPCRGMYLELQNGPMSREHARPQLPAAAGTEEGQRSQPRCRSGSRATEPSGPGAKLDPPDHTQPNPAPHWTQGANGGQYRRLWPL
jgi:hypothetical protein